MRDIDRNDVDISKLFSWRKEVVLNTQDGDMTVYMRLVGDSELNRARVFGLRKSAELRRKLRDETSDERIAYIPEFDVVAKEELVNGMLLLKTREFSSDAIKDLKFNLPAEPNADATLEEQEKYQAEVDSWPQMREDAFREYVTEKLDREEKRLNKLSKEDIYKEFLLLTSNQLCEAEMVQKFREICAYFGSFKDKKYTKRLVDTFEEFENFPSDIKARLIDEYITLEIDGEVLKKSPEVTQ
jgi:hypothetical protein